MARRKTNKAPIIILLVILILVAAVLAGMIWFVSSHFFVGGKAYPNGAQQLDLRGDDISVAEYETIRSQLPDCDIRWDVPFQGSSYPDDTRTLSVQSLSDADLQKLSYFKQLSAVDATGCRDYEGIRKLQERYPELEVAYTVAIAGTEYPQDAQSVVCSTLTEDEVRLMAMLPQLKTVDANGCADPSRIAALREALPQVEVAYEVTILGQTFTEKDTEATFRKPDVAELQSALASLPGLTTVHLVEPEGDAESLRLLMETYPNMTITWEKTVLGTTFNSAETVYDFSSFSLTDKPSYNWHAPLDEAETARIVQVVAEAMSWFPNAEKVILPAYAMHNETMSAFREEMRGEYKPVWTVYITGKQVRTDQEIIHSSALSVCFIDEQSQDLKYCEDAIIVDIGHSYVKDVSWVENMPKLKYLILTHNWVRDISPLETCKELVYLELYWNDYLEDYSPLLGCTSLKDLNVSGTYADPTPLAQMTWLDNLWMAQCGLTKAEEQMLTDALPNTTMKFGGGDYAAGGWRQVPGYFEMRDLMGLPYNTW